MKKEKILSTLFIFIAGCLWGSMGLFVRSYKSRGLDSFYVIAIRAIVTSILMFFYLLITDKNKLKIHIKDLWCFLGTGLLSIIFFNYCYFKAIVITSLSTAAILLYTAPAFVMIMSRIIFKEKITKIRLLAIILTFIGCVFVSGILSASSISISGLIYGLCAGLGYALYSIFSRFALKKGYSSFTITFYTFLIAIIGTVPFTDLNVLYSRGLLDNSGLISIHMILLAFSFGLLSTVLPYILYTSGLKAVDNSTASIVASIEPVMATILGACLYKELLTIPEIAGIILVLIGIILAG